MHHVVLDSIEFITEKEIKLFLDPDKETNDLQMSHSSTESKFELKVVENCSILT